LDASASIFLSIKNDISVLYLQKKKIMQDIITWLQSDMDFETGIGIFTKHCKNKFLCNNLKRNKQVFSRQKLEYEMKKLAGIPFELLVGQTCSNAELILRFQKQPKPQVQAIKPEPAKSEIPKIIAESKEIRNSLKAQIAVMHNQLFDLGESNNADIVQKRSNILNKRRPLIQQHEIIYQLIEEYFITGIVPEALEAIIKNDLIVSVEKRKSNLNDMTDIELVNTKSRLATKISKQKNRLNYQSDTSAEKPCPMPPGPKRTKAENKLKELESEYKSVVKLIKKRENAVQS
jgi:hypothetical protein